MGGDIHTSALNFMQLTLKDERKVCDNGPNKIRDERFFFQSCCWF